MKYEIVEIPLDVVHADAEVVFPFPARSFKIVQQDTAFDFRINESSKKALKSSQVDGFENNGPFVKLYITNSAGATGQKALILVY